MAFGKAFAAARKAGKKEFTYQGKRYNTKVAATTPKTAPTPTPSPRRATENKKINISEDKKTNTGRMKTAPSKYKKAGTPTGVNIGARSTKYRLK